LGLDLYAGLSRIWLRIDWLRIYSGANSGQGIPLWLTWRGRRL